MSGDLPSSTESVRRQNTARILRSLRQAGPAPRAELAKRTGMAKATVGAIVGDLQACDAVVEDESPPDGPGRSAGRPGRPISLQEGSFLGLGLEVNVDYVAAVVLDLSGRVLLSDTRPVPPGVDYAEHPVFALAREVAEVFPEARHRLLGATVAVPALVAEDNRTMAWAPNLGLRGTGLARDMEAALAQRCVVQVDNDANCAALAEAHHGAARDVEHALYLTGTVGIGAGIINEGRLVRGAAGYAGEVGHLPIGDPEARCGCGRTGCWEASIGLHAMLSDAGMPELETPLSSAENVASRADVDPLVAAALDRLGQRVGLGLAMLAHVLDPAVIVLGGYFAPLGERVLAPARQALADRFALGVEPGPELRLSTLGILAAATGAAEQALYGVFAGEVAITA
ncbi:Transcriptional regulator; putative sugar kinase [metagenome]|uniref:Transcriptional regulator putative sugar kinase n=1 Tax=metagenome TaxID=256318 RepID=A0A2P2CBD6_9ZZZZ